MKGSSAQGQLQEDERQADQGSVLPGFTVERGWERRQKASERDSGLLVGSLSEPGQEEGPQASGAGEMSEPVSDVLHLRLGDLTMKLCPEPLLRPRVTRLLSAVRVEELCSLHRVLSSWSHMAEQIQGLHREKRGVTGFPRVLEQKPRLKSGFCVNIYKHLTSQCPLDVL